MPKPNETNGTFPSLLEATPAVFTTEPASPIHTFFAMIICLCSVHLILLLIVASFLLLPLYKFYIVLGTLVAFMFIPTDADSKLGLALARYICKHVPGYFPVTLYAEDIKDFIQEQAYVFGYEPHSVWPIGAGALSALTDFMPNGKVFYTPFMRSLWTWMGPPRATKEKFVSHLKAGCSCVVIPGGEKEVLFLDHDSEVVFLKTRKGFIRLAMETNSPLVPVFAFGQSYVYNWWKPQGKLFLLLSRAIKFTPIIFWGTLWSPIPLRRPILVVVGKPINFKKNYSPTKAEVSKVHGQFVKALRSLFNNHKARAGYPDLKLRIM